MPSIALVVGLCASGATASAEPVQLTLGAGEDTIDRDAQATLSADATAGVHQVDQQADVAAIAEATTQLRTGDTGELAAGAHARWTADYDLGDGTQVPIDAFWFDAELGKRPGLDARRDVAREAFATTSVGFRITAAAAHGDQRAGLFRFGFGGDKLWQGDERRAQITAEVELGFYCRVKPDVQAYCVHVLEMDGVGVSGKQEATVTNLSFVRATGLAGHFELGLGLVTDTVAIGRDAQSTDPRDTVVTENLPEKTVLAGTVGAVTAVGPLRVSVRGARTGYVSLDHDLSIEDRATVVASLAIEPHTMLTATGFAARTRWWSSAMDPGSSAATGGGELAVTSRIHSFDVRAGTGIARSFYPQLDGAPLETPAVGIRSTLQLSRAIDL